MGVGAAVCSVQPASTAPGWEGTGTAVGLLDGWISGYPACMSGTS